MLIDQKIQPHKILLSRQMLQRDMHCPFLDQLQEIMHFLIFYFLISMRI